MRLKACVGVGGGFLKCHCLRYSITGKNIFFTYFFLSIHDIPSINYLGRGRSKATGWPSSTQSRSNLTVSGENHHPPAG